MNFLTKYEKAAIIGVRAKQLEQGAPSTVDTTGLVDVIDIAEKELYANKCPFIIGRRYPNDVIKKVKVSDLIIN